MRILSTLNNSPDIKLVMHSHEDEISDEAIYLVATGRGLLSGVLGQEEIRFRILAKTIRWDRLIFAYDGSTPIGFVAFQVYGSGPYQPRLKKFCDEFGYASGFWRFCLFWAIEYRSLFTPFYLYGLKVDLFARRKGVGSALIHAAEEEASRRGLGSVVLEVSATNDAAKSVYEQRGYSIKRRINLKWFSRFFSFPGVLVLQKKLMPAIKLKESSKLMRLLDYCLYPVYAVRLLTGEKDFTSNPLLANDWLNKHGLHIFRKRIAESLANARRKRMAKQLPAEQVEIFNRQGFIQINNFLPPLEFKQVCDELCATEWSMLAMAQPPAITHRANLDRNLLGVNLTALQKLISNPLLQNWLEYAAGYRGKPVIALQRIRSDAKSESDELDPQANWHADTFHSVGKGWFFLHSVGLEDGPFSYVPGSHRLTPLRREWEQKQSLQAVNHSNRLHAKGSFRVSEQEFKAMEYGEPFIACVQPNTLVLADTSGFHRRTPSVKPSLRLEIYITLRRNPFFCSFYPSILSLPVLKNRWAGWLYLYSQYRLKRGRPVWIPLPPSKLTPIDIQLLQNKA
jgi:ribosomal protein S18 acetylase RimI-like enzyme